MTHQLLRMVIYVVLCVGKLQVCRIKIIVAGLGQETLVLSPSVNYRRLVRR